MNRPVYTPIFRIICSDGAADRAVMDQRRMFPVPKEKKIPTTFIITSQLNPEKRHL